MKKCKSQAKYGNIKLYYTYQIFIYYEGGARLYCQGKKYIGIVKFISQFEKFYII
jgi:hypothetical protein